MTATEKLETAKAKLMLEHPYIGSIAAMLRYDDNPDTLTFHSDGVHLHFNGEYIEQAPLDEVEFALANGAMHALLRHQERMEGRVGRLWQAATDLTVNSMLVKNGYTLPAYVYYDERFDGMYAEEIYDMLQEEMTYNDTLDEAEAPTPDDAPPQEDSQKTENTPSQGNESSRNSTSESDTPPIEQLQAEEIAALEEELAEYFEQLFAKYKRQDALPKGMELVVPHLFSHTIDWRESLYRYIAEFAKSTYSFMPPNMKYLYRGIALPSLSSDLLRIVIAVDTSGSVGETLLSVFLGEVESIMQSYGNYEIDLISADTKVHDHTTYLPGERLAYTLKGGGGTDFRPVFAYIDRHIDYLTLLLYFTDGMGTFPDVEPTYDVMWVMPEAKEVPFGEVLQIQGQ